jgi:hypothetical protein
MARPEFIRSTREVLVSIQAVAPESTTGRLLQEDERGLEDQERLHE